MQKHSFTARNWSLVFDPEKSRLFLYFRTWTDYIRAPWFLFPALACVLPCHCCKTSARESHNYHATWQCTPETPRDAHGSTWIYMYVVRVVQFVPKIAKLSHIIGVRGSQDLGPRPRLWLLDFCTLTTCIGINSQVCLHHSRIHRISGFSYNLASS